MPRHSYVPIWKFGDILTNDEPSSPDDRTAKAMFVAWRYRDDSNPTESICVLATLVPIAEIIMPYCGWWTDA
jgi:hypothetical protein